MKRTYNTNQTMLVLSALFFIFLNVNVWSMHEHRNHVLIEAMHNTLFTVFSDAKFKVRPYWWFLDTYQALLILRHDVASGNRDMQAHSFCTCIYYRMLDIEKPKQLMVYLTVPEYHRIKVQEYIASNGLPELQLSVSSYLKKNN